MDITSLARKNLSALEGYIDVEHEDRKSFCDFLLSFQLIDEDEKIIGFYRNKSPEHDLIVITSQRVVVNDLKRSIASSIRYENIQDIHTEPVKYTNRIFVRQKDGTSNSILISGIKEDKFLDVHGFLRFLKKVVFNIKLNNLASLTV